MALEVRKYNNVKENVGVVKTNQFWEIEIKLADKGLAETSISDKVKFVTDSISGIPGEIEMEKVEIDVMGYHFTFPGKIAKNGTLTWTVFEDEDGKVTEFYRSLMSGYFKGGEAKDADGVRNTSYSPSRYTITVNLYDNDGNTVWRTWTFDNCLLTMSYSMELGQEVAPLQYTFNADFSYFEDKGKASGNW